MFAVNELTNHWSECNSRHDHSTTTTTTTTAAAATTTAAAATTTTTAAADKCPGKTEDDVLWSLTASTCS